MVAVDATLDEILAFCAEEPVERVFLEDIARRGLGRFSALGERGRLTALCHIGANVVPSGIDCGRFASAVVRGRPRMIIGEERAVDELWAEAGPNLPRPRDDRPGQPVYVLDEAPEPGGTGLREATLADVDRLVPACAAAHREEIGIDPLRRDPDGFRWRTRAQVEDGRSWLWREGDVILFKAEASAWTPSAVQLQQVWVDPQVRNSGYAQRGMRDLCRLLLERVPTVCLFVRPENEVAIHVYEAIGMRRTIAYRSRIFYSPHARLTPGLRAGCCPLTERAHRQSVLRWICIGLAALALVHPAAAARGLVLGVDDDSLKWYPQTSSLLSIYSQLGAGAVRVTVDWSPGESFPSGTVLTELARVAAAGRTIRVVLAVAGPASSPPLDDASRTAFCTYAASIVRRYPWIHDVAIWTEPNSSTFWRPQKGAAAAYEAPLARCWDALHEALAGANVIATSAPHARAGDWYRALGKACRATGRALPIFDTIGHNGYPNNSAEPPTAVHARGSIDEGDLGRLLDAVRTGFAGTGQPLPGEGAVSVWYLEDGFQSQPPTFSAALYTGGETDKHAVAEQQQAAQLTAAVDLAYCQPAVGGFFNFELRDEASLSGWQSGLVRPDWSGKPAFFAYQAAIAAVRAGTIDCGGR